MNENSTKGARHALFTCHRNRNALFVGSVLFVAFSCIFMISSYLSPPYHVIPTGSQQFVYYFDQKHWANRTQKRILLWTRYFYDGMWERTARNALDKSVCPYQCTLTSDKSTIKESDAVVFHLLDLYFWESPPKYREPHQVWVLHNAEPPPHQFYTGSFVTYSRFAFNWTFSYRRDSTIAASYGRALRRTNKESAELNSKPRTDHTKEKSKMTYAVISNCVDDAGRFAYVKTLRKYTPIDLYGRCGNLTCPRNATCELMLKSYRFAIAFENSNCKGYVSEKFWNALRRESIPLVNWIPEQVPVDAPPKSYINVHDFPKMEDLAKHLDMLASNDTEYNSYFEWRNDYVIEDGFFQGFCTLCKALHNNSIPAQVVDYRSWLSNDTCQAWTIYSVFARRIKNYFV
ncbi:glycoprotein 3-alpha-L-fucosyltransferase A-like [Saccostrea cucullata]|uniref:glycoprotein 3-alpha-L-fucosyltransferase A-like n=1 Tax=Saccostrea cuccullata TaxID=36930 RepID=UPI002ED28645